MRIGLFGRRRDAEAASRRPAEGRGQGTRMHVATLRLELRAESCPSVRRRRRLVAGIIGKLRRHFNVSAAEDERVAGATEAALVVAAVARSRREARETLRQVADAVAAHPLAELVAREIHDV